MLLADLSEHSRLRLIQMACMAAWADLEVHESERDMVLAFSRQLGASEATLAKVHDWLHFGPPEIDPYTIPQQERRTFVSTFIDVMTADGHIDPHESEMVQLLIRLTE